MTAVYMRDDSEAEGTLMDEAIAATATTRTPLAILLLSLAAAHIHSVRIPVEKYGGDDGSGDGAPRALKVCAVMVAENAHCNPGMGVAGRRERSFMKPADRATPLELGCGLWKGERLWANGPTAGIMEVGGWCGQRVA